MIYLVLGLILLLCQFTAILFFKDKKQGFVYVLFFWIVFQSLLAILTQLFGIFYFWIIFPANILASLVVGWFVFRKIKEEKISALGGPASGWDWIIVFVVLVSAVILYQVHYNYTGKINIATDQIVSYHEVKNMVYPYPYFSDEWDAVSLIKYSINTHLLPLKNPLNNTFFPNFVAPFYSFLAGLILLLRVNPLLSYNIFAIFINTLIILICYVFLRINKLPKVTSAISALSVLYITSAANLPGIWHLIPVHLGIIFSLLGFCFMSLNKAKWAFLSGFFVLIFYSPLIIFYGLALLVFLLPKIDFSAQGGPASGWKNPKIRKIIWYSLVGFIALVLAVYFLYLASFTASNASAASNMLFSRLFYPSLSGSFVQHYNFFSVLPLFVIVLFVFGLIHIIKNIKWLFSQIVVGFIFWALYAFVLFRVIIEYERVVFFTAIIVVLISGFGLQKILEYLDSKVKLNKCPVSGYIGILFLLFFVISIPNYTKQENWKKFILVDSLSQATAFAKAPANNYLVADDVKLFAGIKNKKFLSLPWKGLVVAVATDNIPEVAKEGTISAGNISSVVNFLQGDCNKKSIMAKNLKLDYIYLYEFSCPGFTKIDKSSENLYLYKVN
jgi:hypothetical protein